MENRRPLLTVCLLLMLTVSFNTFAENSFTVLFEKPNDEYEAQVVNDLKLAELDSILDEFVNSSFEMNKRLRLIFGGDDGPLYDSEENLIVIPYAFVVETKERFAAVTSSDDSDISVEDATVDSILHTVFHELAHALIFMNEIPVVAKQEDAADSLATILLIDHFEDGQEIALSAAELFGLESLDVDTFEEQDLSDEHSLDEQRYYQTLCYIYGSDPGNYESILDVANFTDERAELCEDEYINASRSWEKLLAPILKVQHFDEA